MNSRQALLEKKRLELISKFPHIIDLKNKMIDKKTSDIDKATVSYVPKSNPVFRTNVHPLGNLQLAGNALLRNPLPIGNLVTVNLGGGLGNWIFMILAGLGYAEKYGKQFVLSNDIIQGTKSANKQHKQHELNLEPHIKRIFPGLTYVDSVNNATTIKEFSEYKYSRLENASSNVILKGYFQNERYFPSPSVIPNIRTSYYENTYFVHIRAGDYLEIKNDAYLTLTIHKYYKQCFSILGNVKYLVFSNDNAYADKYMKQFNISYTISDKIDQLETLTEMANCAGGICANSSFSWLGAFFQGYKRGNIFMPYEWIKNHKNIDIYPSWARIIDMNSDESQLIDIVIPVGPNDEDIINQQINYTKRNIIGYRNIYLICKNDTININGCITISESIFPFSLNTVQRYHGNTNRNGWYLQQLLKLYAGNVIPGILNKYLIIDTDTFFLKPTKFIDNGKCLYAYGTENTKEYFDHMLKLMSSLRKMDIFKSGICHHMIFENKYINEIINIVESTHGDKFYNIFLKAVSPVNYAGSGASEYEIYFNYMLQKHPNEIIVRKLEWQNVSMLTNSDTNDYESVHWYIRK